MIVTEINIKELTECLLLVPDYVDKYLIIIVDYSIWWNRRVVVCHFPVIIEHTVVPHYNAPRYKPNLYSVVINENMSCNFRNNNNGRNGSCLTWLATSFRGEAQMAYNECFPHEDNVLNKFRIWKERHIQMRENRSSHLVGWKTHPTILPRPGIELATSRSPWRQHVNKIQ